MSVAMLILTGDRGLAGPFNAQILRRAFALEAEYRAAGLSVRWLVVGKKGRSTLAFRRYDIDREWTGFTDRPEYHHASEIGHRVVELFTTRDVDRVVMIFNHYISPLTQEVESLELLPVPRSALEEDEVKTPPTDRTRGRHHLRARTRADSRAAVAGLHGDVDLPRAARVDSVRARRAHDGDAKRLAERGRAHRVAHARHEPGSPGRDHPGAPRGSRRCRRADAVARSSSATRGCGATGAVAGATGTVAGATGTVAGATGTVAGATGTVAGATGTVAGATGTVAGATGTVAGSNRNGCRLGAGAIVPISRSGSTEAVSSTAPDIRESSLVGRDRETVAGRSPRQLFWARFRQDRAAFLGLSVLILLALIAIFAGVIAKYLSGHGTNELFQLEMTDEFGLPLGPNGEFFFGADSVGRDLFVRVLYGARTSLLVAGVATGVAVVIGTLLGLLAGYYGGVVDTVISRLTDVLLSIPYLLFALGVAAACNTTKEGCLGGVVWSRRAVRRVRDCHLLMAGRHTNRPQPDPGASGARVRRCEPGPRRQQPPDHAQRRPTESHRADHHLRDALDSSDHSVRGGRCRFSVSGYPWWRRRHGARCSPTPQDSSAMHGGSWCSPASSSWLQRSRSIWSAMDSATRSIRVPSASRSAGRSTSRSGSRSASRSGSRRPPERGMGIADS